MAGPRLTWRDWSHQPDGACRRVSHPQGIKKAVEAKHQVVAGFINMLFVRVRSPFSGCADAWDDDQPPNMEPVSCPSLHPSAEVENCCTRSKLVVGMLTTRLTSFCVAVQVQTSQSIVSLWIPSSPAAFPAGSGYRHRWTSQKRFTLLDALGMRISMGVQVRWWLFLYLEKCNLGMVI